MKKRRFGNAQNTQDADGLEITELVPGGSGGAEDGIEIVDLEAGDVRADVQGRPQLRRWVRRGMWLFTLAGCVGLFLLLWPEIARTSNIFGSQQVQSTPTAEAISSPLYDSELFTTNGIIYIYTANNVMNSSRGRLEAIREKDGKQIWSYKGVVIAPPLLFGGVLYVPSNQGIDALQAQKQFLLWHNNLLGAITGAYNGILFASSSRNAPDIEALRISDGKLLWRQNGLETLWQTDSPILYTRSLKGVGTDTNTLFALSASTGMQLWRHTFPESFDLEIEQDRAYITTRQQNSDGQQVNSIDVIQAADGSMLAHYSDVGAIAGIVDGILYGTKDKNLNALRLTDGVMLWSIKEFSPARFIDGIFYIEESGSDHTGMRARRASDGEQLWQSSLSGEIMLVQDGVVCINTNNNTVVGLRITDGKVLWENQLSRSGAPFPSGGSGTYFVIGGVLYFEVSLTGHLQDMAVSAIRINDGKRLWQQTDGAVAQAADGLTYITAANNRLVARNTNDGAVRWNYQIPAPQ